MKLTGNSKPSAGYMRTYTSKFSLKKDHIYMVTGSFKASVHTTLYLESENAVTGWEYPNFSTYLPLVSSVAERFSLGIFHANEDYQSDLYVQSPGIPMAMCFFWTTWGFEVTATEISPYSRVFFFANPSRDRVEYSLKKAIFTDVRGKQYAEKLTLEPWSGKILILIWGTFSLKEPPEKKQHRIYCTRTPLPRANAYSCTDRLDKQLYTNANCQFCWKNYGSL
jgi:hypothetical protein